MKRKTVVARHPWLVARNMETAYVVLRIDDFALEPLPRGCIASSDSPSSNDVTRTYERLAQFGKSAMRRGGFNLWKTEEEAIKAATWATNKYGNQYGVFEMKLIVEPKDSANITTVRRG